MRKCLAAAALVLVCAGCIRTLHPLYTRDDVTFDPAIVGTWKPPEEEGKERWVFRKGGPKHYGVTQIDNEGNKGKLEARLVELDGHRFLDFYPEKPQEEENNFYLLHLQPVHTFVKVVGTGETLRLAPMDPRWLQNYLEEHPDALEYQEVEKGPPLLTASTKQLQKFVLKHADDEDAWGSVVELVPVKETGIAPAE